jgi:hypothetical protein
MATISDPKGVSKHIGKKTKLQGAHNKLRAELLLLRKSGKTVFGSKLVKAKGALDGHSPGQKRNYNYAILRKCAEDRTADDCKHLTDFFLSKLDLIWNEDKLFIAKHMTLKRNKFRGTVLEQGEEPDAMYFVFKGVYGVWKDHHVTDVGGKTLVGTLRAGDAFGEISLIHGTARTASIVADGHGELLVLDKSAFSSISKRRVVTMRTNADFLSRASFFNDRQAWHVRDLEFVSQRLTFRRLAINEVLWQCGDPVSPIHFLPVFRRGEAELVLTLDAPGNTALPQISTGDNMVGGTKKIQMKLCTVGPGAVILDAAAMEAVDIDSINCRQATRRLYEQEENVQQVCRRRVSLVHMVEKQSKGQVVHRSSELLYGSGRTVPIDQPLLRNATLVTTSYVELAWLSLQDFDAALVRRRVSMEENAIARSGVDMKRVAAESQPTYHGPKSSTLKWRAAMTMVNKIIHENAANSKLVFPSDKEMEHLYREMGEWEKYRKGELEKVVDENFRRSHTMQPQLAVKKKGRKGTGDDEALLDTELHSDEFVTATTAQRLLRPTEILTDITPRSHFKSKDRALEKPSQAQIHTKILLDAAAVKHKGAVARAAAERKRREVSDANVVASSHKGGGALAAFCREKNIDLYAAENEKQRCKLQNESKALPLVLKPNQPSVLNAQPPPLVPSPLVPLLRRKFSLAHGNDADCGLRVHGIGPLVNFSTLGTYDEMRMRVNMTGIPDGAALHKLNSPLMNTWGNRKSKAHASASNLSQFILNA